MLKLWKIISTLLCWMLGRIDLEKIVVLVVFLYALLPYNNLNRFFSHDVYLGSQLIKRIYYI